MSIASFFNSILKPISKPLYGISKFGINLVTGGAIDRAEDRADATAKAQKDIDDAKKLADLEAQKRRVAASENRRNTDIANQQRGVEAQNISEQSRAAAIQAFQQQSAGEAELGTSGLAEGSTPYSALESQMNETDRKISTWFDQTDISMNISETQSGGSQDIARFNERSSILNEGIARSNISLAQREVDDSMDSFGLDTLLDVGVGVLKTGIGLYGLGSSIEGLKLLTGTENLWDLGGAVMKNPGDFLKLGGAQRYAAATGDMGQLQSMFAEGGAFGPPPSVDTTSQSALSMWEKPTSRITGSSSWMTGSPVGKDKIKSQLSLLFGG